MCTRANRASVSDSVQALVGSCVALASALVALIAALATAPYRAGSPHSTTHGKPASIRHVEVQVHLDDGKRVRAIKHSCRASLRRAARTWAPFPLPLDRVEVFASAPPTGKADIFDQWVDAPGKDEARTGALVVVSVGTAFDGRDLTADEIAGALAGQIERLVIDRYRREHPAAQHTPSASGPATRPVVMLPLTTLTEGATDPSALTDNITDFTSVRALLADIKKSQPLVPAGSSKNGVHTEPNPAS